MNLTTEQQAIVDYAKTASDELILVDSVAGSGKTTLLKSIAKAFEERSTKPKGLYLAYNKAIATESKRKFPSFVDCRTTHSLAYQATVRPMRLKVGYFGYRDIKEKISSTDKYGLVEDIKQFCLSKHTNYDNFVEEVGIANNGLATKYLDLMAQGKIDCTHDFYLKMFHILLANGDIEQDKYDVVMLDEAGDLNEVTLEIFKLLNADVKVAVGDPNQNIYTFNHTINCFERLEGEGTTFKLSKSFRVAEDIAETVEKFCKRFLDPKMAFVGNKVIDDTITTRAYISRTNSGLIDKLIELNQNLIAYGLARKAQEIFKVPLMVAGLRYQGKIYDPAYKYLQSDVDDWYEDKNNVKRTHKTLLGYLKYLHEDDISLLQAINLVMKHGKKGIFDAYAEAKTHESTKQSLTLLTAHSSKGLEFDEVMFAPDMNSAVEKVIHLMVNNPMYEPTTTEKESLNLYYVAATRALVRLRGATYLLD